MLKIWLFCFSHCAKGLHGFFIQSLQQLKQQSLDHPHFTAAETEIQRSWGTQAHSEWQSQDSSPSWPSSSTLFHKRAESHIKFQGHHIKNICEHVLKYVK